MAYEKRVCVLKQVKKGFSADGNTLSGVVYAEKYGSDLNISLKLPGLSPVSEGRYVLVIQIGGKKFCLTGEEMRIADAPSVKDGFAALLCFVRTEGEPVAFGCCGKERADVLSLLRVLSETGKKKSIPTPMPPIQQPAPLSPNVPYAPGVPLPQEDSEEKPPFREQATAYDDEAIASGDYFAGTYADETGQKGAAGKTEEETGDGDSAPHETDVPKTHIPTRGSLTYYREVKEDLDAVMKTNPDTRLKWAFPHSEWARSGSTLIGIVYEEGIPRYLCVAAEQEEATEELKEKGTYVPATPFSDEIGFFVVFQDADTGAYVKVEKT